ncbi:MAG: hypothetical protein AB1540_15080 [Bdellovibrionota bacterium]
MVRASFLAFKAQPLRLLGIAAGMVTTTTLALSCVSAYKAAFETKVRVSIGSELKIFHSKCKLSLNIDGPKIGAPKVARIRVRAPLLKIPAQVEQEFAWVGPADEAFLEGFSGIEKGAAAINNNPGLTVELLADGGSLEADLDSASLTAVLNGSWDKIEASAKASVAQTQKQPTDTQVAMNTQRQGAAGLGIQYKTSHHSESFQALPREQTLVALNQSGLNIQNEYSDSGPLQKTDTHSAHDSASTRVTIRDTKEEARTQGFDQSQTEEELKMTTIANSVGYPNVLKEGMEPVTTQSAVATQEPPREPIDVRQYMDTQNPTANVPPVPSGLAALAVGIQVQNQSAVSKNDKIASEPQGPAGPKAPVPTTPAKEHKDGEAEPNQGEDQAEATVSQSFSAQAEAGISEGTRTATLLREKSPQFTGVVREAFTSGAQPVAGAFVQILGTPWSTSTNENGFFRFDEAHIEGVLPIVITKQGYLKRRVDLRMNQTVEVELVSENAVSISSIAAKETKHVGAGFIFGQLVAEDNETVAGFRVDVFGPVFAKPIYLDEKGVPNQSLTATSSHGQFLVLNVKQGSYLIAAVDAKGVERAPHLLHISDNEGLVRRLSLGTRRHIHGRVFNATATNASIDAAEVRLLGSSQTVTTDRSGRFSLGPIYVDCSEMNYLQVEKSGFYRNRIDFACGKSEREERRLYAFSAAHVDGLAFESQMRLSSMSSVILGHASFNTSVKMQLWGPEEIDASANPRGRDFYFDNDGILNTERNRTSRNGNFVILNAPEGMSYVQSFNKENKTLSFWPVYLSPSTVNVYVQ